MVPTPSFKYFDYDANDNGTIRHFGTSDSDYLTDVLRRRTNTFISYSASLGNPFFAYVAPIDGDNANNGNNGALPEDAAV
jgi:N-acetylglucosamine-6-sulfatase